MRHAKLLVRLGELVLGSFKLLLPLSLGSVHLLPSLFELLAGFSLFFLWAVLKCPRLGLCRFLFRLCRYEQGARRKESDD